MHFKDDGRTVRRTRTPEDGLGHILAGLTLNGEAAVLRRPPAGLLTLPVAGRSVGPRRGRGRPLLRLKPSDAAGASPAPPRPDSCDTRRCCELAVSFLL